MVMADNVCKIGGWNIGTTKKIKYWATYVTIKLNDKETEKESPKTAHNDANYTAICTKT